MASHALVIGAGTYPNPTWDLPAAVSDARRFAEWAVQHGGVDPGDLRFLLSPWPDDLDGYPRRDADRRSIVTALQELQQGAGRGGDRLYVYYAGHGFSAPGVTTGGIQEPVIVPADVTALPVDAGLLIGFSEIMPVLTAHEPREQFFFIDACRDFALEGEYQPGIGRTGIRWHPPNPEAGPRSAQYVLYSTSPGLKAYENDATGRGVFADALLRGLAGEPAATQWRDRRYSVRWSGLVEYVCAQVAQQFAPPTARRRASGDAAPGEPPAPDRPAHVQLPEPTTVGGAGDPELLEIAEEDMRKLDLLVRVRPSGARANGTVKVVVYGPGGVESPVGSAGPPLDAGKRFSLLPGDYAVEAAAEQFTSARSTCRLWSPCVEELVLRRVRSRRPAPARTAPAPSPGPAPAPIAGTLMVMSSDPSAILVVWDSERRVLDSGSNRLVLNPRPGIYRARMLSAEGVAEERVVEVRSGETVQVEFGGAPDIGPTQLAMLAELDIRPEAGGALRASEQLGAFGRAKLASLLGMAAFTATGPFRGRFRRLVHLGVEPVGDAPAGSPPVLVLVGSSRDVPLPGISVERLLRETKLVAIGPDGTPLDEGAVTALAGFPSAGQRSFAGRVGTITVELRIPGAGATRYALTCLPDRRAVLVVVAEGNGGFDVQQYSVPLRATVPGSDTLLNDSASIRRLEIAQRFYAGPAEPLLEGELLELVLGKWLDPLLGAIAGYSLIGRGRGDRFGVAVENMLHYFPDLPDSHVLAGLCRPSEREEHYRRAVAAGLPVFSEGVRVLQRWFRGAGDPQAVLEEPSRALVPGSPWTAWVVSRPALLVRRGSFGPPPLGWQALGHHRSEVEAVIPSVARVEMLGAKAFAPFVGTGFLVAPGIVLTASFVAEQLFERRRGRWEPREDVTGQVDFTEELDGAEPREHRVSGLVRVDENRRLALLRVEAGGGTLPAPLRLCATGPAEPEGRPVYVVGYPAQDLRVPAEAAREVFGEASAVKRLQPGYLMAVREGGTIVHDCFTVGGNAGSPLVDLETGSVLGLHHSGRWERHKIGEAQALWNLAGAPFFEGIDVDWH